MLKREVQYSYRYFKGYFRGKFRGRINSSLSTNVTNDFFTFHIYTSEINDVESIDVYDESSLCTGNTWMRRFLKDTTISSSQFPIEGETTNFTEDLKDVLIINPQITAFPDENCIYGQLEGLAYFKLTKATFVYNEVPGTIVNTVPPTSVATDVDPFTETKPILESTHNYNRPIFERVEEKKTFWVSSFIWFILGLFIWFGLFGINPVTVVIALGIFLVILSGNLRSYLSIQPEHIIPTWARRAYTILNSCWLLFLLYFVVISFIYQHTTIGFLLLFLLIYFLIILVFKRTRNFLKYYLGQFINILFVIFLFTSLWSIITKEVHFNRENQQKTENQSNESNWSKTETKKKSEKTRAPQGLEFITRNLNWETTNKKYAGKIRFRKSDYEVTSNLHRNLHVYGSQNAYRTIYSELYQQNLGRMGDVYGFFDSIRISNDLTKAAFANVIVSCVQYIPYCLVVEGSCDQPEVLKMRKESNAGCNGFTNFGIYPPLQFLYVLAGDCDTRTLFLYTLLKKFGYDVIIMTSTVYRHSILGINLPFQGKYKKHNNKKYYVWETTAPGWQPGMLPPTVANLNYWDVTLP